MLVLMIDTTAIHICTWLFLVTFFLLLYSYLLYPLLLKLFCIGKKPNSIVFLPDELPSVSILLSAHNEEKVIAQKIHSIFLTDYPKEKIEVLIGDDCSTDGTKVVLHSLTSKYPALRCVYFESRRGKPGVINELMIHSSHSIILLTDANIMFETNTIFHLVKHFKNMETGLVGGNIINTVVNGSGISLQEKTYISRENQIKYLEGLCCGRMIGPFGALYAFRKELHRPVPEKFIVDDFYICMNVLKQKFKAIQEPKAIGQEDVSEELWQEFRRKARIASGNFQNLFAFPFALNPFTSTGFCFLSHKVIRWFGPFLMMAAFVTSYFLSSQSIFYYWFFWLQVIFYSFMLIDPLLQRMKVNFPVTRFISYFCWMNVALLVGFFFFVKGIKSSVWEPTKRTMLDKK